ncbi:adenylyltransferase/cytidyltransferase family protein, partial [Stieleria sp.]
MTTGMVLGKFLPPHLGHAYLVDFARHYVDDLTVVVGTLAAEPIPGARRYEWMR